MQTEEQCSPDQRYLFAQEYFSDNAIAIWQAECVKRCRDLEKGAPYESYIHWKRKENEIAVFTLYAYADLALPQKFDILFRPDDPKEFLQTDYELVQSIHEAWLPMNRLNHGHKHLCVFSFDRALPGILNTLHRGDKKFTTAPKGQKLLGFCHSRDFGAITKRIEKTTELKKRFGNNWWEHDE